MQVVRFFFFSSRRRHTRLQGDWSSDVCSSDLVCGDSEMAEGSMWEAFAAAAHENLDNLIAIIDVNRLGQRGETMLGWNTAAYVRRAEAFGWRALEIDGHDVAAIDEAFQEA